jgi:paraquat-inducible protein A
MHAVVSARDVGLVVCGRCAQLARACSTLAQTCPRCGEPVHGRKPQSLSRTVAYLLAAAILYIPANVLPIMHTGTLLGGEDDTIMSGVLVLVRSGSWPLALLVFFASIMVPLLKLMALTLLVISVRWQCLLRFNEARPHGRARLYRLVEFVGRWSLLDIYVLTLLVALVQLKGLATVEPRPGALAFAAVVVLTIFSARSFDPRLLWDEHAAWAAGALGQRKSDGLPGTESGA